MEREAPTLHLLSRVEQASAGIEHVAENGSSTCEARDQAMPAAGIAVVISIVTRKAEEDVFRGLQLDRAPASDDAFVVVFLARSEILAEAVTCQPRNGRTDLEPLGQRRRCAHDEVELLVRAEVHADVRFRYVGKPARHILDGAADRVAAVERALRPAQDLDPLDVIDVEQRALRTIEIDVIEI